MTIDSLDIQISAEVNRANASVELLSKKLDRLSASLSGVNSRGLATLGAGVNKLSNAMSNFSANTKTADFSRLSRNLKSIGEIDTSKFSDISSKISQLSKAFSGIGMIDTSGITNIATSLSELGGKNAIAGADDLIKVGDKLGQFVAKMNGIGSLTFDTSNLANLISSISRLGGKTATEAAKNLPPISAQLQNFVRQLNNIGSLNFDTTNLSNLINGISRLGGRAVTNAIANIPQLATAMRNLMQTLSTAPRVSQNVIQMTSAFASLAAQGGRTGGAVNSLSGTFDRMHSSGGKASKMLSGMQNNFRNLLRSVFPFVSAYYAIDFGKKSVEIASQLTEVQNVVDVTFGDMAHKVEDFAKTSIEQFGLSELALKQYSSRFQAMGSAMGIDSSLIESANENLSRMTEGYISVSDSMSDMSLNLTKLTADMASFYNVEQDIVAEKLASVFTGQTRPLREFGLDLTQATLQEWALKHGIDANVQSMSQAEKTMLRYQYVMANTTAAQGDFARTADTWANSVRILKQNFQQLASVIGGTLVNAFKPLVKAVNAAMSHIIAFAQTIANALGKIFGWTFESGGTGGMAQDFGDAADSAGDIAGGMSDAEKAAKKLKSHLLAIDELNVVEPDEGDAGAGGGAGGGIGGVAGGALGEWKKGNGLLKMFESEIDSLFELGEYIGKVLTDSMNSINWESVYEKARNFGKGLADFLNGLISPDLFGAVGRTIAGALNTAVYAALSFGETFEWEEFGLSIATGVNEFFANFDFPALANTIDAWVQGVWSTVKTAILNVNWEDVWNGAKEFLENIDLETVAIIIGAVTIKKILGLHLASEALSFAGTTLSQKIAQAMASTLGLQIAENAGIGAALLAAWKSIASTFFTGLQALIGSEAAAGALAFVNPVITAITGIGSVISGAFIAVTNFFSMWENGWNILSEILKDLGIAITAVGAVILGAAAAPAALVAGIVAAASTLLIVVHDNWESIKDFFVSTIPAWWNGTAVPWIQSIPNTFSSIWGEIKAVTSEKWNSIVSIMQNATEKFSEIWEKIKSVTSEKIESAISLIVGMPEKIMIIAESIKEWFLSLPQTIGYALGFSLGAFASWIANVYNEAITEIPKIIQAIGEQFGKAKDLIWSSLESAYGILTSWAENCFNVVITEIPKIIESIGEWFGQTKEKIGNALSSAYSAIVSWASDCWNFATVRVPEVVREIWNWFVTELPNKIKSGFDTVLQKFSEWKDNAINFITENVPKIVNSIVDQFLSLPGKFIEIGKNIIDGLWSGITGTWETVKDGIGGFISGFVSGWEDGFDINSPSRVMAGIGQYVIEGLMQPLSDVSGVLGKVASLANGIIDEFKQRLSQSTMSEIAMNAIRYFSDSFVSEVESIKSTLSTSIIGLCTYIAETFRATMSIDIWSETFSGMLESFHMKWEELSAWFSMEAVPIWFEEAVQPSFSEEKWYIETAGMQEGLLVRWIEFTDLWKENFTKWWSVSVEPWFAIVRWRKFGLNMKSGLYEGFKGIVLQIGGIMNGLVDVFNQGLKNISEAMNDLIDDFNEIAGKLGVSTLPKVSPKKISRVQIPAYKAGGFPEDGLFYANSTEIVGRFSNGRTAVANNEQITDGIRQASYDGMMQALSEMFPYLADIAENTRRTADKEMSVNIGDRDIVDAYDRGKARNGYVFT